MPQGKLLAWHHLECQLGFPEITTQQGLQVELDLVAGTATARQIDVTLGIRAHKHTVAHIHTLTLVSNPCRQVGTFLGILMDVEAEKPLLFGGGGALDRHLLTCLLREALHEHERQRVNIYRGLASGPGWEPGALGLVRFVPEPN